MFIYHSYCCSYLEVTFMPVLNQKRQITLPKTLCEKLLVQPGDDLAVLEHQGRITIIKRTKGSSDGVLRHLKSNVKYRMHNR